MTLKGVTYWKSSPMSTITNLKSGSILSSSLQLSLLAHSLDIYIGFQSLPSLGTPVWLFYQTSNSSSGTSGESTEIFAQLTS